VKLESIAEKSADVELTSLMKNESAVSEELDSDAVIAELLCKKESQPLGEILSRGNGNSSSRSFGNHAAPEKTHFAPPTISMVPDVQSLTAMEG